MKKILIIGGSGFLGTNVLNHLKKNNVLNFDKANSDKYQNITFIGNILNKKDLRASFKNVDSIVLLAAEHRDNIKPTSLYYDVNVKGTENVLDVMDEYNIKKIIFTSSVAVYGLNKNKPDEDTKLDPFNHYGKSKALAEKVLISWYNKTPKLKSLTIIRPTVIFGINNKGNVHNLLNQIIKKRFIMIGNGKNKKSMAYVKNVALFIKYILENNTKGLNIFNYVDMPDLTMNELVYEIEKITGFNTPNLKIPYVFAYLTAKILDLISLLLRKEFRISSVRIKKFCAKTQFESSKQHEIYKPKYTLIDGLKETIKYELSSNN